MNHRVHITEDASELDLLIALNDQVVADIEGIGEQIAGLHLTPKHMRTYRRLRLREQKKAKIAEHKELVERIIKLAPHARPLRGKNP